MENNTLECILKISPISRRNAKEFKVGANFNAALLTPDKIHKQMKCPLMNE